MKKEALQLHTWPETLQLQPSTPDPGEVRPDPLNLGRLMAGSFPVSVAPQTLQSLLSFSTWTLKVPSPKSVPHSGLVSLAWVSCPHKIWWMLIAWGTEPGGWVVVEFLFQFFLACFLSPGSRTKLIVPFRGRFRRVPSLGELKGLRGTWVVVLASPHLIEKSQVHLFRVVFLNFCLLLCWWEARYLTRLPISLLVCSDRSQVLLSVWAKMKWYSQPK